MIGRLISKLLVLAVILFLLFGCYSMVMISVEQDGLTCLRSQPRAICVEEFKRSLAKDRLMELIPTQAPLGPIPNTH